MSYAAYNAVEMEESASTKIKTQKSKVFSVAPTFLADQVTRRVVEVVDYELAQGSMPV